MALPAVADFSGAAAPLPNPPWTQSATRSIAVDGLGRATVYQTNSDCASTWNADTFSDDQHCEIVAAATLTGGDETYIGASVRSDGLDENSTGTVYNFWCDGGTNTRLNKYVAGAFTQLDDNDATTCTSGDSFVMDATGTSITVTKNGSLILSATDTDITSGSPGIYLYSFSGVPGGIAASWIADNSTGGGGGSPHTVTGRGSITISAPAWLSSAISGVPPPYVTTGQAEPRNYYHIGMLSWGTANGAIVAYPITRLLDLVELPVGMDTLWYELADGITAVITELASP